MRMSIQKTANANVAIRKTQPQRKRSGARINEFELQQYDFYGPAQAINYLSLAGCCAVQIRLRLTCSILRWESSPFFSRSSPAGSAANWFIVSTWEWTKAPTSMRRVRFPADRHRTDQFGRPEHFLTDD